MLSTKKKTLSSSRVVIAWFRMSEVSANAMGHGRQLTLTFWIGLPIKSFSPLSIVIWLFVCYLHSSSVAFFKGYMYLTWSVHKAYKGTHTCMHTLDWIHAYLCEIFTISMWYRKFHNYNELWYVHGMIFVMLLTTVYSALLSVCKLWVH